jgi:hypothetical protein
VRMPNWAGVRVSDTMEGVPQLGDICNGTLVLLNIVPKCWLDKLMLMTSLS